MKDYHEIKTILLHELSAFLCAQQGYNYKLHVSHLLRFI